VRDQIAPPIPLELEALGALPFVDRDKVSCPSEIDTIVIEPYSPNMDAPF
jgi:hypothetical protein